MIQKWFFRVLAALDDSITLALAAAIIVLLVMILLSLSNIRALDLVLGNLVPRNYG
jgi:hypothetical protein